MSGADLPAVATRAGSDELARPLLPWRRVAFPVPWSTVFADAAGPLHLEVGFGDGRYTVRRAEAAPGERFVGLEISSGSVTRALRRIGRAGLGNVRVAKVGAGFALRHLFSPASLASITVNFPDPWPKERHVGNRLLSRDFYALAAARLAPGGEIRLATDHPDYLDFAVAEAEANGRYAVAAPDPPAAVFETKYALKWRAEGKPLHYRVFRLADPVDDPAAYPILERFCPMPHALLAGRLPSALPADRPFEKTVFPYDDGYVVLHEVAATAAEGAGRGRWLVRATVDEDDIKQQLLVVVQQRDDDEVIVRLESFGDPIVTDAVKGAIHGVTAWLEDATGLAVRQRNYG